jgi:hypothetical protein
MKTILKQHTRLSLSNTITIEDTKSIVNIVSTSHMLRFTKNIFMMFVITLRSHNNGSSVHIAPYRRFYEVSPSGVHESVLYPSVYIVQKVISRCC